MNYRSSHSYKPKAKKKQSSSILWTIIAVLLLIGIFVYSVYIFRQPKEETAIEIVEQLDDSLIPDADSALRARRALDLESQSAVLKPVSSRGGSGEVKRGEKDDNYYLEIETDLAGDSIDREVWEYKVWLLRPVPYDFFATGPMLTNDLGLFVHEWEGESGKDYSDYTRVIITLEKKEGDGGPNERIFEGEFGKE